MPRVLPTKLDVEEGLRSFTGRAFAFVISLVGLRGSSSTLTGLDEEARVFDLVAAGAGVFSLAFDPDFDEVAVFSESCCPAEPDFLGALALDDDAVEIDLGWGLGAGTEAATLP